MCIVKQEWLIYINSSQLKRKNNFFSKQAIIRKRKLIYLFIEENAYSYITNLQDILLKDAVTNIICIVVVLQRFQLLSGNFMTVTTKHSVRSG